MDFDLPEEVTLLKQTVRRFVDEELIPIEGAPPNQRLAPVGCPFAPRCAWRTDRCLTENPVIAAVDGSSAAVLTGAAATHRIACHNPPTPAEAAAGRPLSGGASRVGATGDAR